MCKLSEVPARFLDFAKASPVFACVMMSLTIKSDRSHVVL